MSDNLFYTGWAIGPKVKPPTAEEAAAHEEEIRKSNEARAVIEAQEQARRIQEATQEYDAQAAKVADIQARFEYALAHEPSELVRWQFKQLFDDSSSFADKARAQVFIQQRDDVPAYQYSGADKVELSTCTLYRLLEDAKRALAKLRRPVTPEPAKPELRFIAALKKCRTEEDVLSIDDSILNEALNDSTEWAIDHVLASYVRLFPEHLLTRTLGQFAGRILSKKLSRRAEEARARLEELRATRTE
jgi:hypothetical protein